MGCYPPIELASGRDFEPASRIPYQQAKAKYGIVTSLPFSVESKEQSDEDLLRFYLKSKQNRDQYWEDIWNLIGKKPALRLLYHQEMGKIHSRHYRKRFNEVGISQGWFAVLEGLIVEPACPKMKLSRQQRRSSHLRKGSGCTTSSWGGNRLRRTRIPGFSSGASKFESNGAGLVTIDLLTVVFPPKRPRNRSRQCEIPLRNETGREARCRWYIFVFEQVLGRPEQ